MSRCLRGRSQTALELHARTVSVDDVAEPQQVGWMNAGGRNGRYIGEGLCRWYIRRYVGGSIAGIYRVCRGLLAYSMIVLEAGRKLQAFFCGLWQVWITDSTVGGFQISQGFQLPSWQGCFHLFESMSGVSSFAAILALGTPQPYTAQQCPL